ncbi:LOW QUALITY PROTEIN: reverse transcriptase [Phytophthora megakarya]|uniref:Reverse transcriptase n=1 Tax=Phytophthora megakarya TaxID=4795 RepID=A0A225W8V5_9STRA|nr:LOW QUALITY PROTEIN: reverse transcriptase [Phytophthora megakarya]
MLDAVYIRPSTSPHYAPTFSIKKRVGWRIVHDYRAFNLHCSKNYADTKESRDPGKDIRIIFLQLPGTIAWILTVMREGDEPFTAFQTPDGPYE